MSYSSTKNNYPETIRATLIGIFGLSLYFGTAGLGFEMALWQDFAPLIWPPAGFAIALLLIAGIRYWWVVMLGALGVGMIESGSFISASLIAFGYTVASFGSVWLLRKKLKFENNLERINDVIAFIGIAVFGSAMISSLFFGLGLLTTNLPTGIEFSALLSVRWLSDALGVISLAPFLIVWGAKTRINWKNHQAAEVLVWLAFLVFLGAMIFRNWAPTDTLRYPLELAMFPLTAWASIRFGQRGVSLAILIISMMAVWELKDVIGPEATRTITQPPGYLWVFVGVLSITSLFLAAVLAELRDREDKIKTDEQRLAGFIKALPDLAMVIGSSGKCIEIFAPRDNPLFDKLKDLRGQSLFEVYPKELASVIHETVLDSIRDGEVKVLRYAMSVEGEDRWFEGRFAPIDPVLGQENTAIAFAYDITLNQRANQELQYRDHLLTTLTETESQLLRIRDKENGIRSVLTQVGGKMSLDWVELFVFDENSDRFNSEYRWLRSELDGLVSPEDFKSKITSILDENWVDHLKKNEFILVGNTDDDLNRGGLENFGLQSVLIIPVFVSERLFGFTYFASAVDDTLGGENLIRALKSISDSLGAFIETRKVEEALFKAKVNAESADLAKSEFLAMMSHEIRTPMNAIIGFADLLNKTEVNEEQSEYVSIINRSGKDLLELINNILDFSKLESNSIELEQTNFTLETVVVEALEMVLMKAKQKGIELKYEIYDSSEGIYLGDPLRLRQILVNLLSNAIKFTKEGSVSLIMTTERQDEIYRQVNFKIIDTGVGIPEGKIKDLFKPFEQADSSTTREFGGTGLGLTIVDRITKKMGGSVSVESELGKGTTFEIKIPFECEDTEMIELEKHEDVDSAELFSEEYPLEILVVEDDRLNSRLIEEILKRLGYNPYVVDDGLAAIEYLKENSVGLVLMDMQLKTLNGEEATQLIRAGKAGEENRTVPIVAITAYALQSDKDRILASGVDEHLSKPIQTHSVRDVIKQLGNKKG